MAEAEAQESETPSSKVVTLTAVPREQYQGNYETDLLKQYEVYAESREELTEAKIKADTFFLTLCTAISAAIGFVIKDILDKFFLDENHFSYDAVLIDYKFTQLDGIALLISCIGLAICFAWHMRGLSVLKQLERKEKILAAMEQFLPLAPFRAERQLENSAAITAPRGLRFYEALLGSHNNQALVVSFVFVVFVFVASVLMIDSLDHLFRLPKTLNDCFNQARAKEETEPRLALQLYSKAIELVPTSALAYVMRGLLYDKQGDSEKALQDFNKAIALDCDFPDAYIGRASYYFHMNDKDHSIKDYKMAMSLEPNSYIAYTNIGFIALLLKDYDGCIKYSTLCLNRHPDNMPAHTNRGRAYLRLKQYKKAIDDFTEAIKADGTQGEPYYYRALAEHELRMYKEEADDRDQARKLNFTFD